MYCCSCKYHSINKLNSRLRTSRTFVRAIRNWELSSHMERSIFSKFSLKFTGCKINWKIKILSKGWKGVNRYYMYMYFSPFQQGFRTQLHDIVSFPVSKYRSVKHFKQQTSVNANHTINWHGNVQCRSFIFSLFLSNT